jgi:hypothetical protein
VSDDSVLRAQVSVHVEGHDAAVDVSDAGETNDMLRLIDDGHRECRAPRGVESAVQRTQHDLGRVGARQPVCRERSACRGRGFGSVAEPVDQQRSRASLSAVDRPGIPAFLLAMHRHADDAHPAVVDRLGFA